MRVKSPYALGKYRSLELKYFCLQYSEWMKRYSEAIRTGGSSTIKREGSEFSDPVGNAAVLRSELSKNIRLIEDCAKDADDILWEYILAAVTKDLPFSALKAKGIPCERDMFYDRRKRFFYLLDITKGY